MKSISKENSNDFSIIYKEVEKFHKENPSMIDNFISEEDLQHDKTIREFGEICQEINSSGNPPVYTTFS